VYYSSWENASPIEILWTLLSFAVLVRFSFLFQEALKDFIALQISGENGLIKAGAIRWMIIDAGIVLLAIPDLFVGIIALSTPPRPDTYVSELLVISSSTAFILRQCLALLLANILSWLRKRHIQQVRMIVQENQDLKKTMQS
jgi:hypothetical protein